MRLSTGLFVLVLAWIALPSLAEDQGVVGNWLLVSMEINGEPLEDDDEGARRIVMAKDGKMEAWDGEEKDDQGWYELKADNKLFVYSDDDEDGELDEEEKADGFELTWTRKGKELTLSAPLDAEDKDGPVMTMKFKLIEE